MTGREKFCGCIAVAAVMTLDDKMAGALVPPLTDANRFSRLRRTRSPENLSKRYKPSLAVIPVPLALHAETLVSMLY